jgi:hypothetical protein
MPTRIAVVHLVRRQSGVSALENFIESYRQNPAGVPHDLVFLVKGSLPRSFNSRFQGIPAIVLNVADIGLDLRTYFLAVKRLRYDYFFFLNSYSRILASNWLGMMYRHASRNDVGLVGATGSWQSFATSNLERKVTLDKMSVSERLIWTARHITTAPNASVAIQRAGAAVLSSVKLWDPSEHFPPFPNYHIRTNAFMASRETLLQIRVGHILTKLAAFKLESGYGSLTNQVLSLGLRVLVIGKNGQSYNPEQWSQSKTFRQSSQENLLVADNQTDAYDRADLETSMELSRIAWGMEKQNVEANLGIHTF